MQGQATTDFEGSAKNLHLPPGMRAEALLVDREGVQVLRARIGDRRIHLRLDRRSEGGEVCAELAVLATLSHPGIANLVSFGSLEDGGTFLAREWIDGQDLLAWSTGKDERDIGRIVAALVPALACLHGAGFVHGDIKPENIIIDSGGRPVLTDFGLASGGSTLFAADEAQGGEEGPQDSESQRVGASGSLFALAPELLLGAGPSIATDLFALGALLHQLLVRQRRSAREFYARFPQRSFLDAAGSQPEDLPLWSRDLVVALLARDPERRPRSATEVGQILSGRLGVKLEALPELPPAWPISVGRERWLRTWVEEGLLLQESLAPLDNAQDDGPLWWLQLTPGEDLNAFANTLRVNVALQDMPGDLVDLGSLPSEVNSSRALGEWSRALFDTSPPWVLFVLGEHEHEQHRALEAALNARSLSAPATPLVVLARQAPPTDSTRAWVIEEIPAVDQESIQRQLARILPEENAPRVEALASAMHSASAGVAAVLDVLLRALMREGWLHGSPKGYRLRKGNLPDLLSLAELGSLASQIEALEEQEARVLSRIAVAGGSERLDWLQAEQESNAQAIARLTTQGLVRMTSKKGGTILRLGLPGLRSNLPTDALLEAHAWRLAQLEAKAYAPDARLVHKLAMDATEENLSALCLSCEALREAGNPEQALDLIGTALAAIADTGCRQETEQQARFPALFLERARSWIELGWHDRAQTELDGLEPKLDERWKACALVVRARLARTREDTAGVLELLERAAALAPEAATEALIFRIQVLHSNGKDAEVRAAFRELDKPDGHALPRRQRHYLASIDAISAYRLGAVEEAAQLTKDLLEEVRASGDQTREAGLLINLSTIARRTGRHDEALQALDQARTLYGQVGDAAGIALAGANLGQLLRDDGELTKATEVLREALSLREGLGDREGAATLRGILGLTLAERGHARAAIETLLEARGALSGAHKARFAPLLAAREREMRARIGDRTGAHAQELLASSTAPDPRVLLSSAKAACLDGDLEAAEQLGRRALELARSLALEPNIQGAQLFLATLDRNKQPESPDERADNLTRESARVLSVLSARPSEFDQDSARQIATALGARGRDDLAARVWLALTARAAVGNDAQQDLAQQDLALADKHLALCNNGLTEEHSRHLRRCLLGIPDPWAGDLVPRPQATSTEDELEMRALDLLEINHQLLRQNDLHALLPQIVEKALIVTGAERGFLVLEEDGELRQETALDSLHGDMAEPERELSRSVVKEALARMETICVSNAVDDPLLGGATSVISLELRSILCAPFVVEERLRGVIYVDHRLRTGAFGEGAERLCKLLADQAALAILQVRRRDRIIELNHDLERKVAAQRDNLRSAQLEAGRAIEAAIDQGLIGESKAMLSLRTILRRAAETDIAVLLQGESGTGKDLSARAIHELSPRAKGPFVAENCAALPASLIEAELFGYVKGAFTGAESEREGLIERANGGTLFLDEIGEVSLELQAKLLRVLEQHEVRRLGESNPRSVDFRLVVATNRELEAEIQAGRFREDLYYRLNGISIRMPRLEEHLEDVPALVEHFLRLESAKSGEPRTIAKIVLAGLCRRPWPGNVRELRNEIARLCVLSTGHLSDPSLIRKAAPHGLGSPNDDPGSGLFAQEVVPMRDIEKRAILHALERTGGDKSQAAKLLGLSRGTIYSRLKEYRTDEG